MLILFFLLLINLTLIGSKQVWLEEKILNQIPNIPLVQSNMEQKVTEHAENNMTLCTSSLIRVLNSQRSDL
jgi:hypothetical protein